MEQHGCSPAWCVSAVDALPLRRAVKLLHPRRHTLFCLMDARGGVRLLPEERVIDAYLRCPGETLAQVDDSTR